jgi:hypothetical protein
VHCGSGVWIVAVPGFPSNAVWFRVCLFRGFELFYLEVLTLCSVAKVSWIIVVPGFQIAVWSRV